VRSRFEPGKDHCFEVDTSMNLAHLNALTQQIAVSSTLQDLEDLCRTECARLGFHTFVYALRVPTHFAEARVIMLDGYPEGWVKRYFEAAHFDGRPGDGALREPHHPPALERPVPGARKPR
jgi:hypothetical protein